MKKKILLPILSFFCSSQVWGNQVKKLKDKEFVIKKNRNESLQDIQKPKNLIVNSDNQKFVPYEIDLKDLDLEIKALPITLDLRGKEKKNQKLRNNFIRLGVGMGYQTEMKLFFAHLADIFLTKKFGDCSTHLIVRSHTPKIYPGWNENLQFFADYAVTDFCKPFFVLDQGWQKFFLKDEDKKGGNSSGLDFDFKIGCPLFFEKSEFFPAVSFRHSNFFSKKDEENSKKGSEDEVNLDFNLSLDVIENVHFYCDANLKSLHYDKKCPIYDFVSSGLKELGDDCHTTFIKAVSKVGFVFNQVEFAPKLIIDYCSNKKFVKSDNTNFSLGIEIGGELENKVNLKFDFNNGFKSTTLKNCFKKNPWIEHQAVVASKNEWEIGLSGDTKISNYKLNGGFWLNSYSAFPNFVSVDKIVKFPNYSLEYVDVRRFKGNFGFLFESDTFDALVSANVYHFSFPDNKKTIFYKRPIFKLKTDISFCLVDKIFLSLHTVTVVSYDKKENEKTTGEIYFNVGFDYVFSDLLTFFVNGGDSNGLKLVFGATITPDKFLKKDFSDQ